MSTNSALGATFKVTRALQAACMLAIIGMTSNFIAQIVAANATPPTIVIGTLSIVCVAVLYCVITFILYLDNLLPFLVNTVVDGLFLVTLVVVSVVVGKPLSYLDCKVIGDLSSSSSSATSFAAALESSIADRGLVDYKDWIGTSKATCLEMKSIWGLCVGLCVLFFLSSVTTMCLCKRARQYASWKYDA